MRRKQGSRINRDLCAQEALVPDHTINADRVIIVKRPPAFQNTPARMPASFLVVGHVCGPQNRSAHPMPGQSI